MKYNWSEVGRYKREIEERLRTEPYVSLIDYKESEKRLAVTKLEEEDEVRILDWLNIIVPQDFNRIAGIDNYKKTILSDLDEVKKIHPDKPYKNVDDYDDPIYAIGIMLLEKEGLIKTTMGKESSYISLYDKDDEKKRAMEREQYILQTLEKHKSVPADMYDDPLDRKVLESLAADNRIKIDGSFDDGVPLIELNGQVEENEISKGKHK